MDNPVDYRYPHPCTLCGVWFLTETESNIHTLSHLSQQVHQSKEIPYTDYIPQHTYDGSYLLDRSIVSHCSLEKVHHSIPTSSCGSFFHKDRPSAFHQDGSRVSSLFRRDCSSTLGLNHERYSSTAAYFDKSMIKQEKQTSGFFNHKRTEKANKSYTNKDHQSPHVIADNSLGNLNHQEDVPITFHPDAAVFASKVQQMNVIHHSSLVSHSYEDSTETEHKQKTGQTSYRLSSVVHHLHEQEQQAQQSEHQHQEAFYEKRQGKEKQSENESFSKSTNGTDQAGLQEQIHNEIMPHEEDEFEARVRHYPMGKIVNKTVSTGTKEVIDEVNQNQLFISLSLEKQVPFTDLSETQAIQQPTIDSQGKDSQSNKIVTQSFKSSDQFVRGTVPPDEQQSLQDSQPCREHLDSKFKVTQQHKATLKSSDSSKIQKEQLNKQISLELCLYKKNEDNLDTFQQKQKSQGLEREPQSVVSEFQEVKCPPKGHLLLMPDKEQTDKQGAEQDKIENIESVKRSEDTENQELENLSNHEFSSFTSYPLGHLLTAANFVQESVFTTGKTKMKKTRGPYKKMTKVNFDPASNPEKPYFCDECNKRFKLRDSLRAHQKQGHTDERPWKCEQCGASFKKKGTLTAHYEVHTNIRPFKCESCPATFRRQTELNIHHIKHTDIKPFECELCDAAFAWKNSLKHHMKTHSSEKPYECEVCRATFKWPDSLKLHINTHSAVKEFECDLCSARYKWKRSLRAHKLTHAAIKPFICDLCGCQFVQRAKLKLHMAVHTNDKPFKCELCDMAFARKDCLNAHEKVHSVNKPFKCKLCDAAFRWDYGLKKHLNIHKKAEEHPCSHCGKTFICIRDTKKHEKSHTNPVTYECKECEISFTLQKELNKHNRYAHKMPARTLRKRKRKRNYVKSDLSSEEPEPEMICVEPRVEDLMQMSRDEGTDVGEDDGHMNIREDIDKRVMIVGCKAHQEEEERNVRDSERQLKMQYLNYFDVKKEVIEKCFDVKEERHMKEENLTDEDKNLPPIMT